MPDIQSKTVDNKSLNKLETQIRLAVAEIESLRGTNQTLQERKLVLEELNQALEAKRDGLEKSNIELRNEVEELARVARQAQSKTASAEEAVQASGVEDFVDPDEVVRRVEAARLEAAEAEEARYEELKAEWQTEKIQLRSKVDGFVKKLEGLLP